MQQVAAGQEVMLMVLVRGLMEQMAQDGVQQVMVWVVLEVFHPIRMALTVL